MLISLNIGAHTTNSRGLLKAAQNNKAELSKAGIAAPSFSVYKDLLPSAMKKIGRGVATQETQDMLVEELCDGQDAQRLVMAFEQFICVPSLIFQKQAFYGRANFKLRRLRSLFNNYPLEITLGIRNPATFVPDAYALCKGKIEFDDFIHATPINSMRWSTVIRNMTKECPNTTFHVYPFEDTPVTWPIVLRKFLGVNASTPIKGDLDMVSEILLPEGKERLAKFLQTHPPQNEAQFDRIYNAFIEKYLKEDTLETEITSYGWSEETIDVISELYEQDLDVIRQIPNVNLISI